jgi:hypothetical protein
MTSSAIEKFKDAANASTGMGVALGAVMGAVFGGPIGAAIGGTIGGAIAHSAPRMAGRAEMTPKLKLVYEFHMTSTSDPGELRKLADAFEREGYRVPARMLRARADLRELPEDEKQIRRVAIARAYACDNPDTIDEMAQLFEDVCAVDAAKALRTHANAVRAAVAAGASATPAPAALSTDFAGKLTEAIAHFGPTSAEAQTAAANLIRSNGGTPDAASVAETIGEHLPAGTTATAQAQSAPADVGNPPESVAMPDAVAQVAADAERMLSQIPGNAAAVPPATSVSG